MKKIVVLLATYNGIDWLPEQVSSILAQTSVDLRLVISDDYSIDGSWEWLQQIATTDKRIQLLPQNQYFGGASKNFYRLLLEADLSDADYVAYADQDDIWNLDKLKIQQDLLESGDYQGVSSNVTAFWNDGRTHEVIKSHQQKKFDYLFESCGPGCTFVFTKFLANRLIALLNNPELNIQDIVFHDWLTYAVCRSSGFKWAINPTSTMAYRQHELNHLGANKGFKALNNRFQKIADGWYKGEIFKIIVVCNLFSTDQDYWEFTKQFIDEKLSFRRFRLLKYIFQIRRKFSECLLWTILLLCGYI